MKSMTITTDLAKPVFAIGISVEVEVSEDAAAPCRRAEQGMAVCVQRLDVIRQLRGLQQALRTLSD